jgi:hypothetical protein
MKEMRDEYDFSQGEHGKFYRKDAEFHLPVTSRRLLIGLSGLLTLSVFVVLGHLAFIEVGRDVVVLSTPASDGGWHTTRLWVVESDGALWLHSGGAEWKQRFEDNPIVELERRGRVARYRAHPVPGPHPKIDRLLREKYGLADRWVRFISPDAEDTLVVRLDPV